MKSRLERIIAFIKAPKFSRQFWVYFLCLLVACAFWALTTLSKDYTTTLYFPIEYTNLPEDKIVAVHLPEHLAVEVNSFGFNLLWYKMKGKLPKIIFKATQEEMKSYGGGRYYIATNTKRAEIASQLDNELQIRSLRPDTIFFKFSQKAFKKLPVKIVNDVSFDRQYQLSGDILANPSEVTVSGPRNVIDTMKAVFTDKIIAQNLAETFEKKVLLKKPQQPNVELSTEAVDVTIPIEKFTEGRAEVELSVINMPDRYRLKLFPEKVEVVYLVPLARFEEARKSQFKAYVDFEETRNGGQKLKVSIKQSPDFVRLVKTVPETVEFIIQK